MVNTIELNHSAHSETRPQRAKMLSGADKVKRGTATEPGVTVHNCICIYI